MGLERLKALFRRRGSSDAMTFSKREVFERHNGKMQRRQITLNSALGCFDRPMPYSVYVQHGRELMG